MIRRDCYLPLVLLAILLTGCAAKTVTQATIFQDANWYMNEGVQAFAEADRYRATLFFTEALVLYEGIDDQQGILNTQINLAEVALSVRDYQTAQKHLHRAAVIANTESLQNLQPRVALLNAEIALQQKQYTEAEGFLRAMLPDFDAQKPLYDLDRIQLAAIANQTRIAFARGQDESLWTQRFAKALQLSDLRTPDLDARLLRFQAVLSQRHGDVQEAESYYHRALVSYKASLSRSGIAATLAELGQLYILQGRWKEAREYLNRSNAVYRYLGDSEKVILNTETLIKMEAELGNVERSRMLNEWLTKMKAEQSRSHIKIQDLHMDNIGGR